jgi:uncharacterized protein
MFVNQPAIPIPLAIEFPFPAWATRRSEVYGDVDAAQTPGEATAALDGNFPVRIPVPDDAPF